MTQVSDFVQVRADGNIVPAGMTVKEMLDFGWGPSKVIALRWHHHGETVEFAAQHGVHGSVVPGAAFIAAILNDDESGVNSRLLILSQDGSIHGSLENHLQHAGIDADGRYGWFEPAIAGGINMFGAVFQASAGGEYRCDIDARLLRITRAIRIR